MDGHFRAGSQAIGKSRVRVDFRSEKGPAAIAVSQGFFGSMALKKTAPGFGAISISTF